MERAAILGAGKSLEGAKALGVAFPAAPPSEAPAQVPVAAPAAPFPTLDAAMASHIEAALVRTRGRIEGSDGTAQLLRIDPHTRRARMRKLGVDWRAFRGSNPGAAPDSAAC